MLPFEGNSENREEMQVFIDCFNENEADEVLHLIKTSFDKHVAPEYSSQGIHAFYQYIDKNAFLSRWHHNHSVFTARIGQNPSIAGVMELGNDGHITLLFVQNDLRGQGIARTLIHRARQETETKGIKLLTVSASPNSLQIYKRLGFLPVQEEKTSNGIRFTNMVFTSIE